MINYELARKLKEKGFPQKDKCGFRAPDCDCSFPFLYDETVKNLLEKESTLCYVPTLEELIKACGDRFSELTKMTHDKEPQKWIATTYSCEQCGIEKTSNGYGSTPEEAVASLWLILQK